MTGKPGSRVLKNVLVRRVVHCLCFAAMIFAPLLLADAQSYTKYRKQQRAPSAGYPAWGCYENGWGYGSTPPCGDFYDVMQDVYSCSTDAQTGTGALAQYCCGCGPNPPSGFACDLTYASVPDGAIKPSAYQCEPNATQISTSQPEQCDGISGGAQPPFDKGCGHDEYQCSRSDADGAPVRFSSGRVESNLIVAFSAVTPDLFFGYKLKYNSHGARSAAQTNYVAGVQDTYPKIHHSQEATHYLGRGWLDNFSDRLFINTFNLPSTQITWVNQDGTVTFTNTGGGWRSWGGKYELIDRGGNPADGLGRWVVRTTDNSVPRNIWSFEEFTFQPYNGTATRTLGRLRRHAVLTSNSNDLAGRYGFTVSWTSQGLISSVDDTFGHGLVFGYRDVKKCYSYNSAQPPQCVDERTMSRTVNLISYRPSQTSVAVPVATLQMDAANTTLERVIQHGDDGIVVSNYARFMYWIQPATTTCVHCGSLLSRVIAPSGSISSTPIAFAPLQTNELLLEANDYGVAANGAAVAIYSKYPGREFAYEWGSNTTTQFDLHQDGGVCGSGGACAAGYRCRSADQRCYVATIKTNDTNSLGTASFPAGGAAGGVSGSSDSFVRTYSAVGGAGTTPPGAPKTSKDAAGARTSYGYDTTGRLRCLIRRHPADTEDEAFADPLSPNTSACAGSNASQVVRVDYSSTTITKTTPSLLSDFVVDVQTLDTTTLLPSSHSVTGYTKSIDGTLQPPQTRTTTISRDGLGRVTETNGPLDDSIALDKTTTSYNTVFSGFRPYDFGQVYQVTTYAGTLTSNTPLVTTYANYDPFGVPHCVVGPNLNSVTYEASPDRLTWTIKRWGPGNLLCQTGTLLGTSVIVMNAAGTVRSITDADGVCTTFEYTDDTGYVGAPTRIRRSSSSDSCGGPINVNSGEVEIRTYHSNEPDRLASITRQTNGTWEFHLDFAASDYDRDRRLVRAATQHSTASFAFTYTDVLHTGVTAPNAPGLGTWRTETQVDQFARPTSLLRYIDTSHKITHSFSYDSPLSPRPTQLARGYDSGAASVTTFVYDDFGQLIEATVPEAAATGASTPARARYEYDAAGRLSKRRLGVGTSLVRTDELFYDSLGRLTRVDNDSANPVTCSVPGTPIQDEEYRYDDCASTDIPAGFTCSNAKGRLTMARAIVQCGTGGVTVKRGRWYDYNMAGNVYRIAYATVTGGTIGTPAIMDVTYTAAGHVTQSRSPLNTSYGTSYTYNNGHVSEIRATEASPALIANTFVYHAFGPLRSFVTAVVQPAGGSLSRTLTFGQAFNYDGTLEIEAWRLLGNGLSDIALMHQMFDNTESGLVSGRRDSADLESARYYQYDSLLRMTCEARGQAPSTFPSASDCTESSSRLAGLFTFGNGESASQPADVRRTSFVRGQNASYVSPSLESSTYTNGSSQVQGITRSGGAANMTIVHDALGRRSYEFDTFDATRSRRDYTYLPNGQLGNISGRDASNNQIDHTIRYDEGGHPVTIAEYVNNVARDAYELFWDDTDRLIAVNITFGAGGRACGSRLVAGRIYPVNCTNARWHYHYLGSRLIAATRELIKSGVGVADVPLKRFWAVTDERGLIYRLLDSSGATWWQSRWDASGWRSWVGTPAPEMWVPFALPGQVQLDTTVIYNGLDTNLEVLTTTETWGTRAYASGTGGTWTRPPIALNRWRAYDPLATAFLQPDTMDQVGRLRPEGYAYGRNNPITLLDPTGFEAMPLVDAALADEPVRKIIGCSVFKAQAISDAANAAAADILKCIKGLCGNDEFRRLWLWFLKKNEYSCKSFGQETSGDMVVTWDGLIGYDAFTARAGAVTSHWPGLLPQTELPPGAFLYGLRERGTHCLKRTLGHEAFHSALRNHPQDIPANYRGYWILPPDVPWSPEDMNGKTRTAAIPLFVQETLAQEHESCITCP
jgi:RHS repeat-associated protein